MDGWRLYFFVFYQQDVFVFSFLKTGRFYVCPLQLEEINLCTLYQIYSHFSSRSCAVRWGVQWIRNVRVALPTARVNRRSTLSRQLSLLARNAILATPMICSSGIRYLSLKQLSTISSSLSVSLYVYITVISSSILLWCIKRLLL